MPFDTPKSAAKSRVPVEFWGLARALHKEAKASGEEVSRRIKQINMLLNNTLDRTLNAQLSPHPMKTALRLWAAFLGIS